MINYPGKTKRQKNQELKSDFVMNKIFLIMKLATARDLEGEN